MSVPRDIQRYFFSLGIPREYWNSEWNKIWPAIGKVAEAFIQERYTYLGYYVEDNRKYHSKLDFTLRKMNQIYSPSLPNVIHIEVKANTARVSKNQQNIIAQLIAQGENYKIERIIGIPNMLIDWFPK